MAEISRIPRSWSSLRSFIRHAPAAVGGGYGLARYFAGGAFCVDGDDRPIIARRALTVAAEHAGGPVERGSIYVIGDTPHDIRCGNEIEARTVAVASGTYGVDELEAEDPWFVLERLPSPARFAELLMLDRCGGAGGSGPAVGASVRRGPDRPDRKRDDRCRWTPPALLGQVFTTAASVKTASFALGTAVSGAVVAAIGGGETIAVPAAVHVLASAIGAVLLKSRPR